MTLTAGIVAALFVAHPAQDAALPHVARCYVIGSAPDGVTNVTVQGRSVAVFHTGAWATVVPVETGRNEISISAPGGETLRRSFTVAPAPAGGAPAAEKKWKKLAFAADEPRPHPVGREPSDMTIAIDPGHGGPKDRGAISPHGWCEKDVNLLLAEDVRDALEKLGYNVVMTRRNDRPLDLMTRPAAAHAAKMDAFVSIHHNAPPANGDAAAVRYGAVYCWNALGERLARPIADRMDEACRAEMPSRGVLHANFAVTRSPELPSCLVEADFITNPAGEAAAWNPQRRRRLAAAIAAGIDDWRKSGGNGGR